jgi:hypothetical protein
MPAGSSYSVYGRERAAEHVQNQLALRGIYRYGWCLAGWILYKIASRELPACTLWT